MKKILKLGFGCLEPTLQEQLKNQGLYVEDVHKYEKVRECTTYLFLKNYISNSQKKKIFTKIFNQINEECVYKFYDL